MRHIVEAGTDAAMLTIFDPAAIPEEYDKTSPGDQIKVCDKLEQEGRLKLVNTGSDGAYLLHAYEAEEVPGYLRAFLKEPIVLEKFQVPSGKLYFTGTEYTFAKDDSYLKRHPHMGGSLSLKPGVWHLTLYRTDYPDDFHDNLFKEKLGGPGYKLYDSMGCFVGLAVLAVIGSIVAFNFMSAKYWAVSVLPLGLLLLSLPFIVSNLPSYRHIDRQKKEIEREYPSIVAVLKGAT